MSDLTDFTPQPLTLEERILRLEEAFVHYVLLQNIVNRLNYLVATGHVDQRTGGVSTEFSQTKRTLEGMSQEFEHAFKPMVQECKARRPSKDTLI